MRPTLDRIILKDISTVVEQTEGGIILPEQVQDRQRHRRWEIVSVGPLVQEPLLQPGLEVITSGRFAGDSVAINGETFRFLSEDNVIAIITMEE